MYLERRSYSTGQFAKRAGVSLRTLRYYDAVGLLSPTRTENGYRCYSEQHLPVLQQILALKFLGFSLDEIRALQRKGTVPLETMLARQRAMMEEKRRQLDAILRALTSAETVVRERQKESEAIIQVIQVIQMEQTREWARKYFTDEKLAQVDTLRSESYTESAQQKLAAREWTEADQERVSTQWAYVATESKRLAALGADPAGEEGQALARLKQELLFAFTQGDPEIEDGLRNFWNNHNALSADQQPLGGAVPQALVPGNDSPGARFLDEAMRHLQQ